VNGLVDGSLEAEEHTYHFWLSITPIEIDWLDRGRHKMLALKARIAMYSFKHSGISGPPLDM